MNARMMAGIPAHNMALYHQIRFLVGDPAVLIEVDEAGTTKRVLILRDIEMDRARRKARADWIHCPSDFSPAGGLSGDRETATAQAAAEFFRRKEIGQVTVDRSLPMIYAAMLEQASIDIDCDLEWGVAERRAKDEQEIEWLAEAQRATETVMRRACETVARASAGADGTLQFDGAPLTSERLKVMIDVWLLELGYSNPGSIVAGGPQGADCHESGSGPLKTGQPVIIDIFPQNRKTLYNGDCTRTVVHGDIPDRLQAMHQAVVAAKVAGTAAVRAGVTGEAVHLATIDVIRQHGFRVGLPDAGETDDYTAMVHGTGHGIGLEVHEPPLLDLGGPELVVGDALTIEPGLYSKAIGGVRVEDMVIVTPDGCRNLNRLPEGLAWN